MIKNNKKSQTPMFQLTVLAISLYVAHSSAFAMQELNDSSMRQVDAQDGIYINTAYDNLNIDRLYWEDQAGLPVGVSPPTPSEAALRGYAEEVKITGDNLGTVYQIQTGTNATGQAGIDLKIESRYGTISADSFRICDAAGTSCDNSVGGLTVQSTENATLHFKTQDGLFNQNSLSDAEISLKHINLYLTQRENSADSSSIKNQLIFKNFNFNFTGKGYMYVDPVNGLILETRDKGSVHLNRVCEVGADCSGGMTFANSKPGLNIDLVMKSNTGNSFNTDDAKGMIRLGASGYIPKAKLQFRGTNGADSAGEAILGKAFAGNNNTLTAAPTASTIMGSTGLATRMYAEFSNENNLPSGETATTLELGHGGTQAYGLSFGNLSPLLVRKQDSGGALNTDRAYFDSGNVYINLADTKRMALPQNAVLNAAPFLTGKLTVPDNYSQLLHGRSSGANPRSLVIASRGTNFQALARQTQFIASPDVYKDGITANDPSGGGTWGLGLPFYNLNSNIALYGGPTATEGNGTTAERLGFALSMATQGINYDFTKTVAQNLALGNDGSKTTSIMLIDGKKYGASDSNGDGLRDESLTGGDPINYYLGIRNIDMLMNGYGSIGLEGGKLNINIPRFMLAAAGQFAVGYLPGSQYKTAGKGYAPINGFITNNDVLFGLRLRMEGGVDMVMVPGGNTLDSNYISFDGTMNLTNGAIQIVEPVDGSIIGLDNISGKLDFSNQIKINKDNVDFNTALNINPNKQAGDVLRIKDLNLYPATFTSGVPTGVGNAQRLGEMVFTGGKITSQFNITPH